MRIGLLGGSFNPAHQGHLHISRVALKRLRLDQVWWLVAPQNPLKPQRGMAPFADRLANARTLTAGEPRILVTDHEASLGTRYTADTIRRLKSRYRRHRFVWLMGADNLIQVPRWHKWRTIFRSVPIAVFARPTYSLEALNGKAAHRFSAYRLRDGAAGTLADRRPPAWVFIHSRLDPTSATAIRAGDIQGPSGGGRGDQGPGPR